ncbi:hypothetical protein [Lysinibacter cavernae]|uniref:DUF308 domain-containing protein n=1 Tax=Lysinibacter cavernae TaxID=1640652 RepID=A0A7X5R2T5_9MICO|nr:hypothetical protein [Lysinibacter cavernae]NIH54614.1 hypothetical protein [Lysinibacter cavernae]
MSAVSHETLSGSVPVHGAAPRVVNATRAAVYVAGALILAFTAHLHDASFGHVFFAALTLILAVALMVAATRTSVAPVRVLAFVQVAASAIVGVVSLTPLLSGGSGLMLLVIIWAAAMAVSDVLGGWMMRSAWSPTDSFVVGILGAALALAAFIPGSNLDTEISAPLMGLLGGYLALAGVYLGIAAASVGVSPKTSGTVSSEVQS